jgi:hypothetical protein
MNWKIFSLHLFGGNFSPRKFVVRLGIFTCLLLFFTGKYNMLISLAPETSQIQPAQLEPKVVISGFDYSHTIVHRIDPSKSFAQKR